MLTMNSSEQEVIQNSEIVVPGWVLYTLLQHLEVSWDSKSLSIPQSEVAINSYRLGSRLLREAINLKKGNSDVPLETIPETVSETVEKVEKSKSTKKRKPKK